MISSFKKGEMLPNFIQCKFLVTQLLKFSSCKEGGNAARFAPRNFSADSTFSKRSRSKRGKCWSIFFNNIFSSFDFTILSFKEWEMLPKKFQNIFWSFDSIKIIFPRAGDAAQFSPRRWFGDLILKLVVIESGEILPNFLQEPLLVIQTNCSSCKQGEVLPKFLQDGFLVIRLFKISSFKEGKCWPIFSKKTFSSFDFVICRGGKAAQFSPRNCLVIRKLQIVFQWGGSAAQFYPRILLVIRLKVRHANREGELPNF